MHCPVDCGFSCDYAFGIVFEAASLSFNPVTMGVLFSFISVFQSLVLTLFMHPLHVSVTEINYDEKDKELEVMMRVFIDDLELTMRDVHHKADLDILNPGTPTVDQMMSEYLAAHFAVTLDNKVQKISYLGHERDGEAFVFYVQVSNVKRWKTIQVKNDILISTHEDQSNLVHVTVRGTVRSLRLMKSLPSDKITFDAR